MNHYTTIEQSKRLVELGLDPKTSDCNWQHAPGYENYEGKITGFWDDPEWGQSGDSKDLPCWSVGALLEILLKNFPDGGIMPDNSGYWAYGDESGFGETRTCTTIIDALYEFICWALEKSYIK